MLEALGAKYVEPGRQARAPSAYVIQREAIGLRNHKDLIPEFGLTPEIWNRVGAVS